MSKLLEIFGKGIAINTADLIWHWLHTVFSSDKAASGSPEFADILELLAKREFEGALEKLRFYQFENPDCILGKMAEVVILINNHDLNEAMSILQCIYQTQPNNTIVLYVLGYCYERLGNEQQAIAFYQDCLKFKSHLQLPRQRLAAIYFRKGRLDRVIEEYQRLTAEHPDDISSQVLLGYLLAADQQWEVAADAFNLAILSHPDNFANPAEPEEAELIEQGNYHYALERVQWLMDQMGEMPDLHVRIADILTMSDDLSSAQVHLERALQLQPNNLEAAIKLGTHHLRLGRFITAAGQFNRAVEVNDEIVDAYVGLAVAQELCGDREASYGTLSLAGAIQQNSIVLFAETAALNLLAILRQRGEDAFYQSGSREQLGRVIDAHRSRLLANPDSADCYYKYGMLLWADDRHLDAQEAFEHALQINPTHYRARTKLAVSLFESEKRQRAINTLTPSDMLDLDTLELHYQTAILYCDRRRFATALSGLNKVMQQKCSASDVIINVEVVLENLGLIDRAVATWERLTELTSNAVGN